MENIEIVLSTPSILITFSAILGLIVGSFLNVVIFRLPVMMEREWRKQCHEYLELDRDEKTEDFNLSFPSSHCPVCHASIKPYQNIPIFSYLFLRGRCAHCSTPISIRYPLIEAFSGICSAIVAWHFGYSIELLFALLLTWCLIALSFIDFDHQLLPDSITLPLLWLGLFLSIFSVYTDSHSSIIGAMAGYLCLWGVYQLFKLLTGKEGMGYGDFKLLSMFGAWLGWQYLPIIILLSSLVGSLFGIVMLILLKHDCNKPIPFGPYLAIAGWLALIWGTDINRFYFNLTGL